MRMAVVLGFFAVWRSFAGCPCIAAYSPCNAVKKSDLVFAGAVESIEPRFLNRWTALPTSSPSTLDKKSPEQLKEAYLRLIPDLPEDGKRTIEAAKTKDEVMLAVFHVLNRGVEVHFKVHTIFRDDDDHPSESQKSVVVWTNSGECGVDFRPGETYLVYAASDEQSDRLETSSCTRTRRLTEAGDDLAYLFFLKNLKREAARLEGFVTSDRRELDQDPFHYTGRIGSPVASAVLEVASARGVRYAESDSNGRFVLDGLAEGDYSVNAFAPGYPISVRQLAGPAKVHINRNDCASAILLTAPEQ